MSALTRAALAGAAATLALASVAAPAGAEPSAPSLPVPTTAPRQPANPGVTLARTTARVRGDAALVRLTCVLTRACVGSVRLQSRMAPARVSVYGTARLRIAAGATRTVRVALSPPGRALLRDRGPDRVWAVFSLAGARAIPAARLSLDR
jgi:hypothetical protein